MNPLSDLPVAVDDAYDADATGAASATAPGVLGNDSDADGDSLTAVLVSGPTVRRLVHAQRGRLLQLPGPTAGCVGQRLLHVQGQRRQRLTSNVATVTITLNTPPIAQNVSVADAQEDTAKTITLSASDADGDAADFACHRPANGTLDDDGRGHMRQPCSNTCTADVIYTPDADFNGPDSFTFTANDGIVDSAPATGVDHGHPVNDAPRLENIEAGALAYTENDAATPITATTTVTDDSPDFDTGTLTVDYTAGGQAEDRLEIRNEGTGAGQIGVSGANVTFGGTTIGTFTGGTRHDGAGRDAERERDAGGGAGAGAQHHLSQRVGESVDGDAHGALRAHRRRRRHQRAGDARHHGDGGQRRAGRDDDGRVAEPRRGRRARGDRHRADGGRSSTARTSRARRCRSRATTPRARTCWRGGAAVRRHAELQPGDRHADADGRDDDRELPDDPARGHV